MYFIEMQHSTRMQDGQQEDVVSKQSTTISASWDGMSVAVPWASTKWCEAEF